MNLGKKGKKQNRKETREAMGKERTEGGKAKATVQAEGEDVEDMQDVVGDVMDWSSGEEEGQGSESLFG